MKKKAALLILAMLFFLCLNAQDLSQFKGNKNPVSLSGNINATGGPYIYMGAGQPRNKPYVWNISGGVNLELYGCQFPFSFNIGSQQSSITQPFNRYGVSPYYKWITLHAGYRSMQFSPFVLAGLSFLGAGVELNPKGFRFAAMYGRFNKATQNDTSNVFNPQGIYTRRGYGVKIGFGNKISFLDLMIFKAKDDTNSLKTVTKPVITPAENLAIGLSSRITFFKRLSWELDVAGSLLTNDLRAPKIMSLPSLGSFFTSNISTTLLFAGQTSLGYSSKFFTVRLNYKRVDPNYKTFGAFYQQGDIEAYTLDPNIRLFKNKLRLSGSIGFQHDNLYKRKSFTSNRTIGSVNISWSPGKVYGLDFTFSNYGITQRAGLSTLNDTFRLAQNNQTFSLNQRLNFTNKVRTLSFNLATTYQQLVDLNRLSVYNYGSNNMYTNLSCSYFLIQSKLQLMAGANASQSNYAYGKYFIAGPTIGASKTLFKNKLNISLNTSYSISLQGSSSGGVLNINNSISYTLTKTHSFMLTTSYLKNTTTSYLLGNFAEVRIMGGYRLTFKTNFKKEAKKSN